MARRARIDLLSNASVSSGQFDWPGGIGVMYAEATWGGGTVKLQCQTPQGTWVDVGAGVTFTANGVGGFTLPAGPIRASVATATAVYVSVVGVPSNI